MNKSSYIYLVLVFLLLSIASAYGIVLQSRGATIKSEPTLESSPFNGLASTSIPLQANTPMPASKPTPVPTIMSAPISNNSDTKTVGNNNNAERSPEDLWITMACSACHVLDQEQTDSNRGPVAPHQGNLAERIETYISEQSPEEYVYNSIVDPNEFIVEGYGPDIMPQNFAELMSEEEIRGLVEWLLDTER